MERNAFTLLHDMEGSWWYRGRAAVVRAALARLPGHLTILDFGAGYGGMRGVLAARGAVYAFEPDEQARAAAAARGYEAVYADTDAALGKRYDLIGLFDVLEHLEDDRAFLREAREALAAEGRLLLTVPAMPFLWSEHDVSHHHFRRYTRRSLRRALEEAGYTVEYLSHWNMFLFFPAALARLMGRGGESAFCLPRSLDALLYAVIRFEAALMRFVPLPLGVSMVALARKTRT